MRSLIILGLCFMAVGCTTMRHTALILPPYDDPILQAAYARWEKIDASQPTKFQARLLELYDIDLKNKTDQQFVKSFLWINAHQLSAKDKIFLMSESIIMTGTNDAVYDRRVSASVKQNTKW